MKQTGFTLLELMITVIVIAILTAIALPSYQDYLRRGYRADAKAALMENAQFMERNFTEANRFDKDSSGAAIGDSLPETKSPREGSSPKYTISVTATTTAFALTAAPVDGSVMDGDKCGSLSLNNLGQKTVTINGTKNSGDTAAECWNK